MHKLKAAFNFPLEFIGSIKVELSSVKWPSHQETIKLTMMVIGVCLFVGLYIGALDLGFTTLLQTVFVK